MMSDSELTRCIREGRDLERRISVHLDRVSHYGDSLSAWRTGKLLREAGVMIERLIQKLNEATEVE